MIKRQLILFVISVVLIFSQFTNLYADSYYNNFKDKDEYMGTWIWNTEFIIDSKNEILENLKKLNINEVYLYINKSVSVMHYQDFIEAATGQGINVHALGGSQTWLVDKDRKDLNSFLQWVFKYNDDAKKNQRFKGIHLDIEPYMLKRWERNQAKTVLAYQNTVKFIVDCAKQEKLPVVFDIPFWFDEIDYSNYYGSGSLCKWMFQNTDSICIMAYRDKAYGANGIINLVKNEIDWAKEYSKHVIIAVETGKLSETKYVTFYEEGMKYMKHEMQIVFDHYKDSEAFFSFAMHHYASLIEMKP